MIEISTCFGETATRVSGLSSAINGRRDTRHLSSSSLVPAVQDSVSSLYKITLPTQKHLTINVTWSRNQANKSLTLVFNQDSSSSFKLGANSRFFKKLKGSKSMEFDSSKFEVLWDLTAAKYELDLEPTSGYYVLVLVDSHIGLALGDLAEKAMNDKIQNGRTEKIAKALLISRSEHCSGNALYSTKAKFCDYGSQHDILMKCTGENGGMKHLGLYVYIDQKMVIKVKKLKWNFRGNQTVSVDGLLIDMLWDFHDWLFNPSAGSAVFMFRTRSRLDSRLWFEENTMKTEQEDSDFSLLIHAFNSKSS